MLSFKISIQFWYFQRQRSSGQPVKSNIMLNRFNLCRVVLLGQKVYYYIAAYSVAVLLYCTLVPYSWILLLSCTVLYSWTPLTMQVDQVGVWNVVHPVAAIVSPRIHRIDFLKDQLLLRADLHSASLELHFNFFAIPQKIGEGRLCRHSSRAWNLQAKSRWNVDCQQTIAKRSVKGPWTSNTRH